MRGSIFGLLVVGIVAVLALASWAEDAKDEAIRKDRLQIAGTWRGVALVVNGNVGGEEGVHGLTVVNGSDGSWCLSSEGKEVAKGTSTFDPTQTPKHIDFVITEGDGKGNQHRGIYELGESQRRLCFAPAGKERPKEFAAPADSELILVTFQRETGK